MVPLPSSSQSGTRQIVLEGKQGCLLMGVRGPGLEDILVDLHVALKACSVEATMGFSGYTAGFVTFLEARDASHCARRGS